MWIIKDSGDRKCSPDLESCCTAVGVTPAQNKMGPLPFQRGVPLVALVFPFKP